MRLIAQLTEAEMDQRIGAGAGSCKRYEAGEGEPNFTQAIRACEVFQCVPRDIMAVDHAAARSQR